MIVALKTPITLIYCYYHYSWLSIQPFNIFSNNTNYWLIMNNTIFEGCFPLAYFDLLVNDKCRSMVKKKEICLKNKIPNHPPPTSPRQSTALTYPSTASPPFPSNLTTTSPPLPSSPTLSAPIPSLFSMPPAFFYPSPRQPPL